MINISLTDFIDFTASTGTVKYNKVAAFKRRENYTFRVDYWREMRNTITGYHANTTLKSGYFDAAIEANFLDAGKKRKMSPFN